MSRGELWTRDELILALNLYLKLDFGKMHKTNPEIISLARTMGRTASSIAIRLTNFASVDPYHQKRGIKGMVGGIKQVKPIWDEFIHNKEAILFESENILAKKEHQTIETKFSGILEDIKDLKGETKIREVKTRVNQSVFRQIVLTNYNKKCAITGINLTDLLVASHIIPWAENEAERLNPGNGLCLNSIHDRAFEVGLITILDDYTIKTSSILKKGRKDPIIEEYFLKYENKSIELPLKYLPDSQFLRYHTKERFKP
jgi:putative restriction endonuclease